VLRSEFYGRNINPPMENPDEPAVSKRHLLPPRGRKFTRKTKSSNNVGTRYGPGG